MLNFLRDESCKTCVKFARAILAICLDALIAIAVVQVAIAVSYIVGYELRGSSYEDLIERSHVFLTVLATLIYGIIGIYDGAESLLKTAKPPC